jgi:phage tail-like protein
VTALYVDRLPMVLAADDLLVRFLRGFEDVGTDLYDRADEFPALFDPHVAPPDIVRWMAGWIGILVDAGLPDDRCRAVATAAMRHFAARGTAAEVGALVAAATGAACHVIDPGGVHRGVTLLRGGDYLRPDLPVEQRVELVIELESFVNVDETQLAALVESTIPAWLPYSFVGPDAGGAAGEVTDD